jgi:hypothetical protein
MAAAIQWRGISQPAEMTAGYILAAGNDVISFQAMAK